MFNWRKDFFKVVTPTQYEHYEQSIAFLTFQKIQTLYYTMR